VPDLLRIRVLSLLVRARAYGARVRFFLFLILYFFAIFAEQKLQKSKE
jgi:hypothetical protein